jgi:RNA polymerase sigma-70 factor (ECF subfamily)
MAGTGTGEDVSVEFLARRHHLMAFVHWMAGDPDLAEEVFQQVWVKLAEAVRAGTLISHLDAWCRVVARNILFERWRRERVRREIVDSRLVELSERAFAEQDDSQDDWALRSRALKECVGELPAKSRRMLDLKYGEGLTVARTAEMLEKTCGSVMMALSRIRRALKECVERRLGVARGA